LSDTLALLRRMHRSAPFLFFNGNTFAELGRQLISASASLMAACAEANVSLSFHNPYGKFLACSNGFTSGNILLRREQYRRADDEPASVAIAANMIAAKLHNTRQVIMRAARDHGEKSPANAAELLHASDTIAQRMTMLPRATSLDTLRGIEGDAATFYFAVFPHLLVNHDPAIAMTGRSRRPPLDPVNALISFLYSLLMHDCRSALESCGLDERGSGQRCRTTRAVDRHP
jgi:CRISPR-associated protein Cas1